MSQSELKVDGFPPLQGFTFEVVTVNNSGGVTQRRQESAKYYSESLPQEASLEMVAIPGGSFLMGSPPGEGSDNEKPQHQVTVPPFFMGKYPVTQKQWEAVASLPKIARDLKSKPSHFKGDERPVESVNWYDAVEFCQRLSGQTGRQYRLPSEAEWEYACRAGTTTPFYCGETITTELANYNGNYVYANGQKGSYREETTPVMQFPPNPWGLYDMHGNVWEWCADTWHGNYTGAPSDGSAWLNNDNDSSIMLRGASWFNFPLRCRSAYRNRNLGRDYFNDDFGFRVVCGAGRVL
jgi:formylglycine-generating enzyme required for sulfatase activity